MKYFKSNHMLPYLYGLWISVYGYSPNVLKWQTLYILTLEPAHPLHSSVIYTPLFFSLLSLYTHSLSLFFSLSVYILIFFLSTFPSLYSSFSLWVVLILVLLLSLYSLSFSIYTCSPFLSLCTHSLSLSILVLLLYPLSISQLYSLIISYINTPLCISFTLSRLLI